MPFHVILSTLKDIDGTNGETATLGQEAIEVSATQDYVYLTQKDTFFSPIQGEVDVVVAFDREQGVQIYNILKNWLEIDNGS